MTDNTDNTQIATIRTEASSAIEMLLGKLTDDLGDEMLSLTAVGSVLTGDFHPKRSDINTVLVVKRRSHRLLELLAGYGRSMGKRKLSAPLMMTPEYIEQSMDVFGVELLDYQLNHTVLCGDDPFSDLSFNKNDVRLQCERDLKAALIRLRQGYISALGKSRPVAGLLLDCASQLSFLLRAMLWLTDNDRPIEAMPTLEAAAGALEFDAAKLSTIMRLRIEHSPPKADQVEAIFEDTYQIVDHLAKMVDKIGDAS